jgi:hypothetical protein
MSRASRLRSSVAAYSASRCWESESSTSSRSARPRLASAVSATSAMATANTSPTPNISRSDTCSASAYHPGTDTVSQPTRPTA